MVTRYFGFLTGGIASQTMPSGSSTSQRAQRGSPVGAVYVAMIVAASETGSSCERARKVKGTMVGVRLPPASEGSTTVSALRKSGGTHDATSVTFSRVAPEPE